MLFNFYFNLGNIITYKEDYKMKTDKIYVESIINEYAVKNNSKIIALRKLDAKAKMPAILFAKLSS